MKESLLVVLCCALVGLATGCIGVPGPQEPCPYSAVLTSTPAGALLAAMEDECD